MTAAANAKLDAEMKSSIPKDARIIAKSTDFIQQADGTLIAVLNVQTIENIGYIQYYWLKINKARSGKFEIALNDTTDAKVCLFRGF